MTQLLSIALATFISEDLTCIAVGALVAQKMIGFVPGVLACFAGIFAGDILLFLGGRFGGRHILRFLSADKIERASSWLQARGPAVVFTSRFTPGLRTATYFAAGVLRTSFRSFAGYFLLATAIWTPLAVGIAAAFGARLGSVRWGIAAAIAFLLAFRTLRDLDFRRRFYGFVQRRIRWEFWPAWAAYLPLVPYFAWLAIRFRSLTVFTAANPGIPSGGLVGESKSRILSHLSRTAEFNIIRGSGGKISEFPIVLKPDVGERGSGVAVIRSQAEYDAYFAAAKCDTIAQRYIGGLEFGVFYFRYPHESAGCIFSITEKRFPELTGDGRRTLRELVLADDRAVCIASTYEKLCKRSMSDVPAKGERVKLVEIGSHCRGAIFLDGSRLRTGALEYAIDASAKEHPGFYFGRFDVRTPSPEAFQRGEFTILELNGVGAEATHIYDPSVTLLEAYRVMRRQWRIAFEIGDENRKRGARAMTIRELVTLIRDRRATAPLQPCPSTAPTACVRS
jgi:membrane protein DedA with SNARE-associated domain